MGSRALEPAILTLCTLDGDAMDDSRDVSLKGLSSLTWSRGGCDVDLLVAMYTHGVWGEGLG